MRGIQVVAAAFLIICAPAQALVFGKNANGTFPTLATADPLANQKTIDTFFYLSLLPQRTDHKYIISQMYNFGPAFGYVADVNAQYEIEQLHDVTGKYPGAVSIDYNDYNNLIHFNSGSGPNYAGPGAWPDYTAINNEVIGYAKKGALVAISYHAMNPWGFWEGHQADCSLNHTGHFADLINPAMPVYANWIQMLDHVAVGLQQLQAAGVTVIWRPFFENNIATWWWGQGGVSCSPTQADFAAVWQHMFNYFTTTKGLHNLLWFYSPNSEPGTGGATAMQSYPGDAYVDLLGLSQYGETVTHTAYGGEFQPLNKPIMYGETGPPLATWGTSTKWSTLPADLDSHYPLVSYFMGWGGTFSPIESKYSVSLMNDSRIATLEDVKSAMDCLGTETDYNSRKACVTQSVAAGSSPPPASSLYLAEGDSITSGGGNYASSYLAAFPGVFDKIINNAASGATLSGNGGNSLSGRAAADDALIAANPGEKKYVLSVLIGKNDLPNYSGGAAQYAADLAAYLDAQRGAGWYVIMITLPPATTSGYNAARNLVNSRIYGWLGQHADAIADVAGDAVVGCDSCASNATYYGDGIHPTDPIGQDYFRKIIQPALNSRAVH